jgi:pilus assembly protein Flp/PilA
MLLNSILIWLSHLAGRARDHFAELRTREAVSGQGLVEYALILVLVAVVVIVILSVLGPTIGRVFSNVLYGVEHACGLSGCGGTG